MPVCVAPYHVAHTAVVERRLGEAVSAVFDEATAEDPCAAIGWHLVAEPPIALTTARDEEGATDDWSLVSWLQGVGVHRAVAAAILRPLSGDTSSNAVLEHLKGLKDRKALATLLRSGALLETIVDLVWTEVETLQSAGAAKSHSEDMQSKFAGAIEMSYSGLDTFFGGLEGVVGSPSANIMVAMAAEHTKGPDTESTDAFVTSNYGVTTSSMAEWAFVAEPAATPDSVQLERWPEEAEDKLPDRSRCRKRRTLPDLEAEMPAYNQKLTDAGQPPLISEELLAACLYTGPMFVKYNAVLRGLRSESPFLRRSLVKLCCPARTFARYVDTVEAGCERAFKEALSTLNYYTTTLHGINSAIIKLGKLTVASKIYRGITGMKLPKEFWEANQYGVRGGVESAFMSTTHERAVAMGYAAGDSSRTGIVIEVQQGMVNRGADISWLSQYPHEREVLFGPLTGIEVQSTRVDGSVVVIECAFSINLTALTLEQVISRRHKLLLDTCTTLRNDFEYLHFPRGTMAIASEADGGRSSRGEWAEIHGLVGRDDLREHERDGLKRRLDEVCGRDATEYNDNETLVDAIRAAMEAETALNCPKGLEHLLAALGTGVHTLCDRLNRDIFMRGVELGDAGLSALMHVLSSRTTLNIMHIDLSGCGVGDEGARILTSGLRAGALPYLAELSLVHNRIRSGGFTALMAALVEKPYIHSIEVSGNLVCDKGVDALSRLLGPGGTGAHFAAHFGAAICMLNNIFSVQAARGLVEKLEATERMVNLVELPVFFLTNPRKLSVFVGGADVLEYRARGLSAADAVLIAATLRMSQRPTCGLNLHYNAIGDDGAAALAACLSSPPCAALHYINFAFNGLGSAGAIALFDALAAGGGTQLASLRLECNNISDSVAGSLRGAAPHLVVLETLSLFTNELGDELCAELGAAMVEGAMPKLTRSFLGNNRNITSAGRRNLARGEAAHMAAHGGERRLLHLPWMPVALYSERPPLLLVPAADTEHALVLSHAADLNGGRKCPATLGPPHAGKAIVPRSDLQHDLNGDTSLLDMGEVADALELILHEDGALTAASGAYLTTHNFEDQEGAMAILFQPYTRHADAKADPRNAWVVNPNGTISLKHARGTVLGMAEL